MFPFSFFDCSDDSYGPFIAVDGWYTWLGNGQFCRTFVCQQRWDSTHGRPPSPGPSERRGQQPSYVQHAAHGCPYSIPSGGNLTCISLIATTLSCATAVNVYPAGGPATNSGAIGAAGPAGDASSGPGHGGAAPSE